MDWLGSPELKQWLAGQSVACVLLLAWVLTLRRDLAAMKRRNDALSDSLVQTIERGWHERYKQAEDSLLRYDSSIRNLLEHFSELVTKLLHSSGGKRPSSPAPPPAPPAQNLGSTMRSTRKI